MYTLYILLPNGKNIEIFKIYVPLVLYVFREYSLLFLLSMYIFNLRTKVMWKVD